MVVLHKKIQTKNQEEELFNCGTLKRVVWYFEEGGVVL